MSIGMILLTAVAVLIFFGVAQRVLDKMRLSDKAALTIVAAMFFLSLVPNIAIGQVSVNLGGAVVPVFVCAYLLIKAESGKEVFRALLASVLTGTAVFFLSRYLPSEAEYMTVDPNYLYGLAAGIIAYIFGRSRRGAFIAGVLGVLSADVAVAVVNWRDGISQPLVLGGAGALDTRVLAGLIAVILAELVGEVLERIHRGKAPEGEPEVSK